MWLAKEFFVNSDTLLFENITKGMEYMTNIKEKGKESCIDKKMNDCSIREKIINKKGSSLILAMVVIALISILSTLVLSLALNAYRTSVQSKWADEDFYYCEDYLEQARQSIVEEVNKIIIDNYRLVSSQFSTQSMEIVNNLFRDGVYESIKTFSTTCGNTNGLLNKEIDLSAIDNTNQSEENVGKIKIEFNDKYYDDSEIARVDEEEYKYIFKDVTVTYLNGNRSGTNQNNFFASVTTDIVIKVPTLDFNKEEDYRGSLSYILISGGNINFNSDSKNDVVDVKGNVYAGKDLIIGGNSDVKMLSDYITVLNEINNAGTYEALAHSATANIWCKNITLSKNALSTSTIIDANLFVADDLQIDGKNSFVQLSGKYFGYSEGESAIIVNGKGTTLDMTGLDELVLNGHSFFPVTGLDNYKGQESLATIVSQSLYMVHEKYIKLNEQKPRIEIGGESIYFEDILSGSTSLNDLLKAGYILVTGGVDVAKVVLPESTDATPESTFVNQYLEDVTSGDSVNSFVSIGVFEDDGQKYCYLYWNFKSDKKLDSGIHADYIDISSKTIRYGGNTINFSDIPLYYNNEKFKFKKSGEEESVLFFNAVGTSDSATVNGEYENITLKYKSSDEAVNNISNFEKILNSTEPVKAIMLWNEVESCYDIHLQWNFKYAPEFTQSKGEEFISKCIKAGLANGFLEKFMDGGEIKINGSVAIDTKTEFYEYYLENGLYTADRFNGINSSIHGSAEFSEIFKETYNFYKTTLVPEKYDPFSKRFEYSGNGNTVFDSVVKDSKGNDRIYIDFATIDNYFSGSNRGTYTTVSFPNSKNKNVIINGNLEISDGTWSVNGISITKYTDQFNSFDGIIFVNGDVSIKSDVVINGLIISDGNINISKGNYVFDEKIVKNCLDALKADVNFRHLVSDEFYSSDTNSSANSKSLNAADYISYENWTRNKDKVN